MKVALASGPYEPGRCGVGDYTFRLAQALRKAGALAEVVTGDWRLRGVPSLLGTVQHIDADILHIQYPTAGFGHKLGPQGLAMCSPTIVTVHEASGSHLLRKLSLYPFSFRSKHVIFTTEVERRFALRWAPWIAKRSSVIPIGSNIDPRPRAHDRSLDEILYFGLIRPGKGIEDVLSLAELLKTECPHLKMRIVGSCRPEQARYAAGLRERSRGLSLVWEQDVDDSTVARRLAGSWIAYLPFPDGASDRRGSLKAALASGMAIVTTRGRETPRALAQSVRFCPTPQEALAALRELISNPVLVKTLGENAQNYAQRFSWDAIASQHLSIYRRSCTQRGTADRLRATQRSRQKGDSR
jgi:glycosyltransferase involved in cell wall biosynthesis